MVSEIATSPMWVKEGLAEITQGMKSSAGSNPEMNHGEGFLDLVRKDICILTFGCTYNHGDSRKLETILISQGCRIVPEPELADVLIVNTCTVVGATEHKMIRVLRKYHAMPLYVTGCMMLVQKEEIRAVCDPVFIHPDAITEWFRRIPDRIPRETGIVQIGKGCRGACTYCITRYARGPPVNYMMEEILDEIKKCTQNGAFEIRLCAQDCSAWRGERQETIADLLSKTEEIQGSFLIRVGMMNPATLIPILDPVIESFMGKRVFRFVHLPVQSGSDRILSRMGRGYTRDEFTAIVNEFRKKIPDITFATDIITGFPGEDEEDFQESIDLISVVQPAKVNITRYSSRPHTLIADVKAPIDYIRKVRSRKIQSEAEVLYQIRNRSLLGRTIGVTVTEHLKPGSVLCRSSNYTGVVIKSDLPVGKEVQVRIVQDRMYFFSGELVSY